MKNARKIIVISLCALAVVGYFFYLTQRQPTQDATLKSVQDAELAALTTMNIDDNYPQSPKEVMKLYARINKAYYKGDRDGDDIAKLAKQARKLFDTELIKTQTDDEFLTALKSDIAAYNSESAYIAEYKIDDSESVHYTTFKDRKYASLTVTYIIRKGNDIINAPNKYTLRQDLSGRWKILFWEVSENE